MSRNTVTMFDVARHASVNQSTVSLALRDDPRIPEATRRRIAEAARELNYTPNHLARSLSGGRSRVIGVMLPDLANRFFVPHLQEIQKGAQAAGLSLTVKFCDWDLESEERGLRHFWESRVDGVIWSPIERPHDEMAELARRIKLANAQCVVIGTTELRLEAPRVGMSEIGAIRTGIEYLLKLGHRKLGIATAARMPGVRSAVQSRRDAAMRSILAEAGLPVRQTHVYTTSDNAYGGVGLAAQIASTDPDKRPTAIFAADDMLARALIAGLTISKVKVPNQISVLGFDDAPGDAESEVALTSVSLQSRETGARVTRLMLDLLARNSKVPPDVVIELQPKIVERDSCARLGR